MCSVCVSASYDGIVGPGHARVTSRKFAEKEWRMAKVKWLDSADTFVLYKYGSG